MNRLKFQAIIFLTIIATVAGLLGKFHSHDSYQNDDLKNYGVAQADGSQSITRSPMSIEIADVAAHFCFACQSLKSYFQIPIIGLVLEDSTIHRLSSYQYAGREYSRRLFQPPRS